ncbi:hypothetical protein Tco_1113050 [Tanacetum coccineum]|uniref:Uncharacterized protein n=1 Tax=Tanacetum coccineum TaxID=301880 RepID=A0ABQ5IR11_9ASTR
MGPAVSSNLQQPARVGRSYAGSRPVDSSSGSSSSSSLGFPPQGVGLRIYTLGDMMSSVSQKQASAALLRRRNTSSSHWSKNSGSNRSPEQMVTSAPMVALLSDSPLMRLDISVYCNPYLYSNAFLAPRGLCPLKTLLKTSTKMLVNSSVWGVGGDAGGEPCDGVSVEEGGLWRGWSGVVLLFLVAESNDRVRLIMYFINAYGRDFSSLRRSEVRFRVYCDTILLSSTESPGRESTTIPVHETVKIPEFCLPLRIEALEGTVSYYSWSWDTLRLSRTAGVSDGSMDACDQSTSKGILLWTTVMAQQSCDYCVAGKADRRRQTVVIYRTAVNAVIGDRTTGTVLPRRPCSRTVLCWVMTVATVQSVKNAPSGRPRALKHRCITTPVKRKLIPPHSVNQVPHLQAMIDEGVTAVLATRATTRNGDDSHTSGTGCEKDLEAVRSATFKTSEMSKPYLQGHRRSGRIDPMDTGIADIVTGCSLKRTDKIERYVGGDSRPDLLSVVASMHRNPCKRGY